MAEFELIKEFFESLAEYEHFLAELTVMDKTTEAAYCMARLTKVDETKWLYRLDWVDHKFVAEHVAPFPATQENVDAFNRGAREMARRLHIYIKTKEIKKVPTQPPAFAHLSFQEK